MSAVLVSAMRSALDRALLGSVETTLFAAAVVFAALAATQRWFSEPALAFDLARLQGFIAAISLLSAVALRARPPGPRVASLVLLAICAMVSVNNGVILARIGDPQHTTNMLLVSIVAGFAFLDRSSLLAALGLVLASWLPTALAHGLLSPGWSHWTKMLVCSQAVAISISASRRRTLAALEERRRLEAAMREPLAALGMMTAGIAHQVNNPLGAILTSTEVALATDATDARSPRDRALLEEIQLHAQRASQIARSVMQIARAERPERWRCDVGAALDTVRRVASAFVTARGGRIVLEVEAEVRKVGVWMNPIEFEEAIVNLIRNAVESRPSGVRVRLVARRRDDRIELIVEDDGPGIPDAVAHRVFEPFFTTRAIEGGSGLGLSMAVRTIEGLGGTLELLPRSAGAGLSVDPRIAEGFGGARFRVQLPVASDPV